MKKLLLINAFKWCEFPCHLTKDRKWSICHNAVFADFDYLLYMRSEHYCSRTSPAKY